MQKTATTQRNVITALARQVSQQQLHAEETARSYGDSGLKITRLTRTGSKPYFMTSFAGICLIICFFIRVKHYPCSLAN